MLRLLLLISFLPNAVYSQYSKQHIKAKADSFLLSVTNQQIFEHAVFDARGSYYAYRSDTGTVWELLDNKDISMSNIEKIFVRYVINYPYSKCEAFNFVSGITTIQFDGSFQLVNKPDVSYIPDFVMRNKKCDFISEDRARAIAKKNGFVFDDYKHTKGSLGPIRKDTVYWNFSTFIKQVDSMMLLQMIEINARNGKVEKMTSYRVPFTMHATDSMRHLYDSTTKKKPASTK